MKALFLRQEKHQSKSQADDQTCEQIAANLPHAGECG